MSQTTSTFKTADQIAEMFFHDDRPSRLDTENIWTHITWREWGYFLTQKQGAWLMEQAVREGRSERDGYNGHFVRGTFKRGDVTYHYKTKEVGKNKQVMFRVSCKETDLTGELS